MGPVHKSIIGALLLTASATAPAAHAQSNSVKGLSPQTRALIAEVSKFGDGDPSRDPEGDLVKLAELRKRIEADRAFPVEELGSLESATGAGHFYARRYAKAVEHYKIAARHFEQAKAAPSELAGLYSNMGTILSSLTRYDEAEAYHRQALAIRETLEGKRGASVASSLFGIGYVYYRTGRIEESIPLLRESVEQQLEFLKPDNPLIVVRMTSLASVLSRSGREAEGLKVARRAEEIGRKNLGEKHPTYAIALHNLGTALVENGNYSEAVPMMREALRVRVATIGETASGTALSLRNLSTALKKSGAIAEAEELSRKAAEIFARSGETDSPQALATLYYELADFAALRGDWTAYDRFAVDALAEVDKKLTESNFERARLHLQHAERQGERGKAAEALAIAERWVPVMQKALIASHVDRIWAEMLLASLRQTVTPSPGWDLADNAMGRLSAKLANIAVSDRQLVREAETNRKSALLYFETALRAGDHDRAFAALQLVNISDLAIGQQYASDTGRSGREGEAAGPAGMRRNLLDLARRLSQAQGQHDIALQARQTEKVAAIAAEVIRLEGQVKAAEANLQARFPNFVMRYRPSPVTLAQFRATLSDSETLLAPVEGPRGTTVVSITRAGMAWHRADVSRSVSELRRAIEDPAAGLGPFPYADAEKLYRALFPKGVKPGSHVLFHGGGALASLPLPLLLTRKYTGDLRRAPWLLHRASFQVVGNLALRKLTAPAAGSKDGDMVIGIGGVDLPPASERRLAIAGLFRSGSPEAASINALPALPNAARELRAIAEALPGENDLLLIGADAREERLKSADLSKARIIAFATHGLVAGEVRDLWEPALLVGTSGPESGEDGLLGAHEIAQLKLSADWVILSACNTSSGDRRDGPVYSGLATAFAQAGAKALLLSHWQVRDDAAAVLSVETVRGTGRGLGRAEALRRAQLALLADRKVADSGHPAIWAPFIIVEN